MCMMQRIQLIGPKFCELQHSALPFKAKCLHCVRTACALRAHCVGTVCALRAHCSETHPIPLYNTAKQQSQQDRH